MYFVYPIITYFKLRENQNKSLFCVYNFAIKTNNGNYYYLCIALNNHDNYIVTAVKNTKNGVESYITGKGKTSSKVPNALQPVAPFSKKSSANIHI